MLIIFCRDEGKIRFFSSLFLLLLSLHSVFRKLKENPKPKTRTAPLLSVWSECKRLKKLLKRKERQQRGRRKKLLNTDKLLKRSWLLKTLPGNSRCVKSKNS